MFCNQRRQTGQGPHGQSRKGCNGHQPDHSLIDIAVVFFSLQPDPLVGARRVHTFAGESRCQVVIREVSVECAPGAWQGVPEQVAAQQYEHATWDHAPLHYALHAWE